MKAGNGKFKRGAVVALDPKTGAILAMVSTPSYDPNKLSSHNSTSIQKAWKAYLDDKSEPMLNRALEPELSGRLDLQDHRHRGRVEEGREARPTASRRRTRTGRSNRGRTSACPASLSQPCVENFEGETCHNGKTATLAFALAKSCNTAFAALAVERLRLQALKEQAQAFGFDRPQLNVPLPVAPSTIGSDAVLGHDDAALAQTSFGQRDVRITPLQAAMLAAAVANDGTLMSRTWWTRSCGPTCRC